MTSRAAQSGAALRVQGCVLCALWQQGAAACMQAAVLRRHEKVHRGGCNAVTFSASGLHAASCGVDGVVALWSAQDGSKASEICASSTQASSSVNAVQILEHKGAIMAASNDKSIKVWDMHTARLRFTMTGARPPPAGHCCLRLRT
jgi:WD40 repeat protein